MRNRVLFQQDKARNHTSRRMLHNLDEFDGVKLLPHLVYSPDFAPTDFYIFRSMAHFLSERIFDNIADVEQGCREFFASKPKDCYLKGINNGRQWQRTINQSIMTYILNIKCYCFLLFSQIWILLIKTKNLCSTLIIEANLIKDQLESWKNMKNKELKGEFFCYRKVMIEWIPRN